MNMQASGTDIDAQMRRAVVLGGSLTGLLAARVLSNHFATVTLIERDVYPETPDTRRGIPQASHVHGLLTRGRQILEELFPGIRNELVADGAPYLDLAKDIAWLNPAGWGARFSSDLQVLTFTRPLLDHHVRRRLAMNPRIGILANTKVTGLVHDADNNRINGVLVSSPLTESETATTIPADLVVDATGRSSPAARWLTGFGYAIPDDTIIDANLGYASRLYSIPDDFHSDWECVIVQAAPPERKRGGLIFRVEGNRWLVTLVGGGGDHPPNDDAGFVEFARSLTVPTIFDSIKNAEPVSGIKTNRATQNRLRHFERAARLPDNFLVLGDAVCAFNPVYGQGMTVSAIGAMELDRALRELSRSNGEISFEGFAMKFQKRLAKINKAPWMMATAQDFRYKETTGGRPGAMTKFMHNYIDQVGRLGTTSPMVRNTLLQMLSMLAPRTAIFRPAILFRVLRLALTPEMKSKPAASASAVQQPLYQTRD